MEALSRRHYETCHLPGAINLLYEFVDEAEKVLPNKHAEIGVYRMNEDGECLREEVREIGCRHVPFKRITTGSKFGLLK